MSNELSGADLQFLIDSTWKVHLSEHQMELICLSILNASLLNNREIPKKDLFDRAEDVYRLWDAIRFNRLANEMKQNSNMKDAPD